MKGFIYKGFRIVRTSDGCRICFDVYDIADRDDSTLLYTADSFDEAKQAIDKMNAGVEQ